MAPQPYPSMEAYQGNISPEFIQHINIHAQLCLTRSTRSDSPTGTTGTHACIASERACELVLCLRFIKQANATQHTNISCCKVNLQHCNAHVHTHTHTYVTEFKYSLYFSTSCNNSLTMFNVINNGKYRGQVKTSKVMLS